MAGVTATIVAGSAIIGAGATVYNSMQQHQQLKDAQDTQDDITRQNWKHADDIVDQIELEAGAYSDDLEAIAKQNKLAYDKIMLGTESAFEQTGDTLANVIEGTYNIKSPTSGAAERIRREARDQMEETSVDLSDSVTQSLDELAFSTEQSEVEAERRYQSIIGNLEAQYFNLTGEDMPGSETEEFNVEIEDEDDYDQSVDGG